MADKHALPPALPLPTMHSFGRQVRNVLALLPPSEKRLGEFVLRFSGDLAAYSASELAAMVGVSNATVSRFIRRLGYNNYEAARLQVRSESRSLPPDPSLVDNQTGNAWTAELQLAENNLRQTLSMLLPEQLDTIADALVQAKRVYFFGTRNNHNFASYLRWQLLQVISCADIIPGPGETLGEYLPGLNQDDLLVVFDLRRSQSVTKRFTQLVIQRAIPVLYITDRFSADNLPATWILRCETQAIGSLDNHIAPMMICHLLANRVIQRVSAQGKQRLASIEWAHDQLKEL